VVLAHGFWNTAGIFLPTANTLSSEGIGAFAIQTLMEIIVAAVIVARTGAANLSRTEPRQMQA
jgi:hypothetical protein